MREIRRMTEAEFAAVRHLLRISTERIAVAYAHLVGGKSLRTVADEAGCSHQAVSKASSIVWTTFEKYCAAQAAADQTDSHVPPGWEQVTLIAPSHLVPIFREEIAAAAEAMQTITLTPTEASHTRPGGRKKARNANVPG